MSEPDRLAEILAFLRRRLNGEYEVDEFGYDPELTDKVLLELLRPIYHRWFRVETVGVKNVPEDGGALVVANHSGTLPVDALMTQVALHDEAGRALRLLGADLVYQLPVLGHLSRKSGHTLACREDADRMLRKGELVGVFPEGYKGLGKPYADRYKLQRFGRGGFVASAIRAGVPIVPTAIVGAEEIYPKLGDMKTLARALGLPYLPITPLFPWLGPLGLLPLPSKWMIEFGEPIRTDEYEPGAADDPMLVFNLTDHVREVIQQMLNELRLRRGHAFV
ncbi:lysophospholipid acyltransferase family protein [Nonomuraea sp. NPDC059007]|uniref:lysophospholipid acyltransferase family protein n=1 Tax=Nonomuraea sp. NPDC059007 TaxID=3346692 RepID=UPI0036888488